jgi:beta-lactamase regulating signal transducer with metallopeptidase domain
MGASLTFLVLLVSGLVGGGALYGILARVCLWAGVLCVHASHSLCRLLGLVGFPDNLGLVTAVLAAGLTVPGLIRLWRTSMCLARRVRRAGDIRAFSLELSDELRAAVSRAGLDGRVVLVGGAGNAAFTSGLCRPVVYLGDGLVHRLSPAELEAVLRHEASHVRRFDPLRTAIGDLVGAVLWFLPVLRDLERHLACQMEVEADREAVERIGRKPLAGALYKLITTGVAPVPGVAAVGLMTEARLKALVEGPDTAPALRASSLIWSGLSAVAMTCLLVL